MTNRTFGMLLVAGLAGAAAAGSVLRAVTTHDDDGTVANVAPAVGAMAASSPSKITTITVPRGTAVRLRLETTVGSNLNRVEDPVEAVLTSPVIIDNRVVLPAGSVIRGIVTSVQRSGRVKGRAQLGLRFETIKAGRDRYDVTMAFAKTAPRQKAKDVATIALPAAGGAVVGAIVGGKKGAAIGTAIGGGGGTAVVLATRGKEVRLPRGTVLVLHLQRPVDVRMGE